MTRHIADHTRESGVSRTRNYTRQDRESGTHPAIDALRMRPRARDESGNRRGGIRSDRARPKGLSLRNL